MGNKRMGPPGDWVDTLRPQVPAVLDVVPIAVPAELRGGMPEMVQERTTAEWTRVTRAGRLRRWLRNRL